MKTQNLVFEFDDGNACLAPKLQQTGRLPVTRMLMTWTLCVISVLGLAASSRAQDTQKTAPAPGLESGFYFLYSLKPVEAKAQFEDWQKSHPDDPLGTALQAANYLLEECYREGVLTSEYFLDDKRSADKKNMKPDPAQRAAFYAAFQKAQELAQARLKTAPNDPNALFAMSLSLGMQADYAGLIEKRGVDSLRMMMDAGKYAKQLLSVDAGAADAYLALGAANYIIGSLPGHQRFFLGFKGIHGDQQSGLKQLEIAATQGHYLRPFAKMLLALAALRDKKPDVARVQFAQLSTEFPANPLFASELGKLNITTAPSVAQREGP